ncbi:hypothetical protein [Croceitalea rosinachiae]|uniref:Uncharacterized protein n=1 Tax=Croceitalea rosinachiae TaxID=3075596 RepID=A0ABU3A8K8_9FLAO|nr:hypothetical protein [Croceitalea sp. F388]MDT0606210.1 hypothetical protein [Croceitalea sp. F388]
MSEYKLPIKFASILFIVLVIVFGIHLFLLNIQGEPLFENLLVLSYVVNFLLAVIIFVVLFHYRYRLQNAIGFLFMGGSLIKFIAFFLIFYPSYKSDGDIQRLESIAFFVPYLSALVLETFYTSKMLNGLQKPED